ncbi:MAG: PD-(D/E)XK nuclease family protein [Patescibacteria group bacterium]|nr:PD-(D/E)XK nuclease family protein [Patescibacteria group bacterium]
MKQYPIKHWSYSSLLSFLRNPLAWHKRYVEGIYDTPSTPAGIIGRAGHVALQHFYGGLPKDAAVELGAEYLRKVPDFEVAFGKAESKRAQKEKRAQMEREYFQAVSFYLARPPRHKVLGVEVAAVTEVPGLPLPIKAISDLVVESRTEPGAVDIVDHKFVDSFSALGAEKPLFVLQAIFNYYTVQKEFGRPVKRFILQECKKRQNKDGRSQMRRYVINYEDVADDFRVFHKLITEASAEIARPRAYLPNPSDMFEGKDSFEIYRLGLLE